MDESTAALLRASDPHPVITLNAGAASPFLLLCDHAGRQVPAALGTMGVAAADWDRHIAWDIGAAAVCTALAERLGAEAIMQAYSRLVIDCNRKPGHPSSIPVISDATAIPANQTLSAQERALRVHAIFAPYHAAIAATLDRRAARGQPSVIIAMHSFTPVFGGFVRPWHASVLYNRYPDLAQLLKAALQSEGFNVGDNEPYQLTDDGDYAIPVHAEARGLPHVELEIRQDLISSPAGQLEWANRLARILPAIVEPGGG